MSTYTIGSSSIVAGSILTTSGTGSITYGTGAINNTYPYNAMLPYGDFNIGIVENGFVVNMNNKFYVFNKIEDAFEMIGDIVSEKKTS